MESMIEDTTDEPAVPEDRKKLVLAVTARIKADKEHHKKAFDAMRRDMFVVRNGYEKDKYPEENYRANLCGRHIKTKTAALYAKNPKAVARRRETLDFQVWDENPQSLMTAFQALQQAQAMLAPQTSSMVGPDGQPMQMPAPAISPEMEAAFAQAQAVVADYQQGMQRRQDIQKIGKTLEILFAQALREQKPVDFKTGMKQLVRRACTCKVGYIELGFQRETGPRPGMTERLADARIRLDHMERLAAELAEGEMDDDAAERAELQSSIAAIQAEPEIILREGLIIDYPAATRVIPDKLCTSLTGFIGARHVTVEYFFSADEVRELFKVELGRKFKGYGPDGKAADDQKQSATMVIEEGEEPVSAAEGQGLVCVWKHYDKTSGLVYYVADGHDDFLREPAAPDVFVEDFWPLYALVFNEVESEDSPFPPSDVELMLPMQNEYNRSRQGMREHRKAARPRWVATKGVFEDEDLDKLANAAPFTTTLINPGEQGQSIADRLQVVPVPGVDPNLYETGQLFTDIQLVVGTSEAQFGGTAKATATESAIAANSSASSDGSSIDDLDAFLTVVARAGGQILMKEMSPEQVMEVVGPGAVWPPMTLEQIANEVFLEVEAGSTGKPNQAVEMNNWQTMLPFLIQMPGIQPHWLARESLRRLDDRMDLTEALAEGIPSIMMMNQQQQPGTGDPATDPNAQGGQGSSNAPAPPAGEGGSGPAFGSNQV